MATPRPLAVGSSTPLEPPWLRRPEAHVGACGCPTLTPYSWEGLGVVSPPPAAPRLGSVRPCLGHVSPSGRPRSPPIPRQAGRLTLSALGARHRC